MSAKEVVLECKGICKSFGVTKALIDVDLEIRRGEVHGLVGENGSGKSTLSSIFAGVYSADSGGMKMNGAAFHPANIVDAEEAGIAMITQEQGTVSGVSIGENLFLGKEKQFSRYGMIDLSAVYAKSETALKTVSLEHLDPSANVETLNFEDRKLIEIARALDSDPAVLIIDETTTALSADGRIVVKSIIHEMRERGKSVLFISHDIEELMEHCDCITVLRDGRVVDTCSVEDLTMAKLQTMMVGREFQEGYYRTDYEAYQAGDVALSVRNLSSGTQLENVSFDVRFGEILGISGLSNSGIHELGKTMFGLIRPITGKVTVVKSGQSIHNSRQALKNNIAYIPKNRDTEALFLHASVEDNIAVTAYDRLRKGFYIGKGKLSRYAEKMAEEMSVKYREVGQPVIELSGGNKQKVVFSKWLGIDSDIFIMDCPTRGIDIGVKSSMYQLMDQMRKDGKAIILISEELPELIGMSDRLMVMKDGVMTAEFKRSRELSEADVIQYMI